MIEERFYKKQKFWEYVFFAFIFLWILIPFRAEITTLLGFLLAILRALNSFSNPSVARPEIPVNAQTIHAIVVVPGIIIAFALSLLFFAGVTSQGLLPVRGRRARWMIVERLLLYMVNVHGPALFVKDGKELAREHELDKKGPGVIVVDLNSAVVLDHRPKRRAQPKKSEDEEQHFEDILAGTKDDKKIAVYGPGIAFTHGNQHLRGAVDLRTQIRFQAGIRATTKDGINVKSNIFAVFTLGQPPEVVQVGYDGPPEAQNLRIIRYQDKPTIVRNPHDQSWRRLKIIADLVDDLDPEDQVEIHRIVSSNFPNLPTIPKPDRPDRQIGPYHFDSIRVFQAVYARAKDVVNEKYIDWTDLPTMNGADIFRNMLSRETFDYLYQPENPTAFPFAMLKRKFAANLRNQGVLAFQFIGCSDRQPLFKGMVIDETDMIVYPPIPLQTPRLLRSRGIRVIHAGFTALQPENFDKVSETLISYWASRWEKAAGIYLAKADLEARRVRYLERAKVQKQMAYTFRQIFDNSPRSKEALALRIFQALEMAATEPATRRLLPGTTIEVLRSLRHWLLPEGDHPLGHLPGTVYDGPQPGDGPLSPNEFPQLDGSNPPEEYPSPEDRVQ